VRRRLVAAGLRQVFHDDALVTDERIDEYEAPMARPGAVAAAAELLGGAPGPFPIAAVRAPTLVLWGRDDRWIPPAHAARFAEAVPGARVEMIDACGHVPQEEQPAVVGALLAGFLALPARVD
jgi:pimeloyl-ACP methyl ester carboxylesterase